GNRFCSVAYQSGALIPLMAGYTTLSLVRWARAEPVARQTMINAAVTMDAFMIGNDMKQACPCQAVIEDWRPDLTTARLRSFFGPAQACERRPASRGKREADFA